MTYMNYLEPWMKLCPILPCTMLALLSDVQSTDFLLSEKSWTWEYLDLESLLAFSRHHIERCHNSKHQVFHILLVCMSHHYGSFNSSKILVVRDFVW